LATACTAHCLYFFKFSNRLLTVIKKKKAKNGNEKKYNFSKYTRGMVTEKKPSVYFSNQFLESYQYCKKSCVIVIFE